MTRAGTRFGIAAAACAAFLCISCATRGGSMVDRVQRPPRISVSLIGGPGPEEGLGSLRALDVRTRHGGWIEREEGVIALDDGALAAFAPDGSVHILRDGTATRLDGFLGGGPLRSAGKPAGKPKAAEPRFWTRGADGRAVIFSSDIEEIAAPEPALSFIDGRRCIALATNDAILAFSEEAGKGRRGLRLDRFSRPDDEDGVSAIVPVGTGFRGLVGACLGPEGLVACALVVTGEGYELRGFRVSDLSLAFTLAVEGEASPRPRGVFLDASAPAYVVWDDRGFASYAAAGTSAGPFQRTTRLPYSRGAGRESLAAANGVLPEDRVRAENRVRALDFRFIAVDAYEAPGSYIALVEAAGEILAAKVSRSAAGFSAEPISGPLTGLARPVEAIAAFPDGRVLTASRGALFDGAPGASLPSVLPFLRLSVLEPLWTDALLAAFDPAGIAILGKEAGADGPLELGFTVDAPIASDAEWAYLAGVEDDGASGLYRYPVASLRSGGKAERERLAIVSADGRSITAGARNKDGHWLLTDGFALYLADASLDDFRPVELRGLARGGRVAGIVARDDGSFAIVTENAFVIVLYPVSLAALPAAELPIRDRLLCACADPATPGAASILAGTAGGRILRLSFLAEPGRGRSRRLPKPKP